MSVPLEILYPNGRVEAVQVYIWDVATLSPKLWDGALTAGTISIGSVSVTSMPPITGTVGITGTVSAVVTNTTLPVSGTVAISNTTLPVTVSNTVNVTGTVAISNTTFNSTVSGTVAVSNMIPAVETGLATSAKQDTLYNALLLAQGTTGTTATGPLVQALVNDTPSSYSIDSVQPLSLTAEGRLRVSSVDSNIDKIWQETFDDPWNDMIDPSPSDSNVSFAGEV